MLTTSTRVFIDFFFYFPPCLDLSRVIRSSLLFLSAITWQYNVPIYKNKCIFVSYSTKGVFFFFYEWIHTGHGTTVSNNGFSIRISLCFDFNDKYELVLLLLLRRCAKIREHFDWNAPLVLEHASLSSHERVREKAFESKLRSLDPFHPLVRITSFGITNRQTFRLSLSSSSPRLFRQLNVFPFRTLRQGAPHLAGFASHFRHALPGRLEVHFQVEDDERIRG